MDFSRCCSDQGKHFPEDLASWPFVYWLISLLSMLRGDNVFGIQFNLSRLFVGQRCSVLFSKWYAVLVKKNWFCGWIKTEQNDAHSHWQGKYCNLFWPTATQIPPRTWVSVQILKLSRTVWPKLFVICFFIAMPHQLQPTCIHKTRNEGAVACELDNVIIIN